MAVASNNLVCLNKDQNVFDSKKRIKAATAVELEYKLNSVQRILIAYNEILFSIMTNQKDSVQKLLDQFQTKFNDKTRYTMIKTYLLYKEKKYAECEKLLKEVIELDSIKLARYYLIQILVLQNKTSEAIEHIKKLDEYNMYKLGISSALVSLYKLKNDKEAISDLFAEAIGYHNKKNINSRELEIYVRENSNFQIECGNMQRACEMLEKMRSYKPHDYKILSKLINIYSKFDNAKAKKLSEELPSLDQVFANAKIDIDTLESQFTLLNSKYGKSKSIGVSGQSAKSPDAKSPAVANKSQTAADADKEKKKKKKRKIKLPKNYNPAIPLDLERWMPLRERSYYKGKRNKKKNTVGKGTQGAVAAGKETPAATSASSNPPQSPKSGGASVASPDQPPKPRAAATAQAKKKKKYGGKW